MLSSKVVSGTILSFIGAASLVKANGMPKQAEPGNSDYLFTGLAIATLFTIGTVCSTIGSGLLTSGIVSTTKHANYSTITGLATSALALSLSIGLFNKFFNE